MPLGTHFVCQIFGAAIRHYGIGAGHNLADRAFLRAGDLDKAAVPQGSLKSGAAAVQGVHQGGFVPLEIKLHGFVQPND